MKSKNRRSNRREQPTRRQTGPTKPSREQHRCIRSFLEALGTPRALSVWLLFSTGEHSQLVSLTCDPNGYSVFEAEKFRLDYAATRLLSKCADLTTGINTKEVAIAQAEMAEAQCASTNTRFRELRSGLVKDPLYNTIGVAAFRISNILGPCPESFDEFVEVGWSPGRTSSCYGDELSGVHKYTGQLDCTPSAFGIVRNYVNASPLWAQAAIAADAKCSLLSAAFNIVEGNTMTVVPKNAKTDRTICYEPHGQIRPQLAVGGFIRQRLALHGIDLRDQSINQRRAALASRTGHLATIDLSSASDTVALELVRELLPPDWFALLNKLRSPTTQWPDGSVRRNAKFSSMGNGFTFELESMIFYALCSAITTNVSVYGDDIILPTHSFGKARELLEFCGFTLNATKSFHDSHFRESCGTDVFCGLSCTPLYIRRFKGDDWFVLFHNGLRQWASVLPERRFAPLLKWIRTLSPSFEGCSSLGDGHYHVNFDEACPTRARFGVEGWWFTTLTRSARVSHLYGDRLHGSFSGPMAIGALCVAVGPKPSRSVVDVTVDKRLFTYKKSRVLSREWQNVMWV